MIPGGSSTPILTAAECEKLTMDYEALAAAGSMLGSGAVIVIGEGTCMVNSLKVLTHFYAHEACSQCTPCREGTGWMNQIMGRIVKGQGRIEDLDLLLELGRRHVRSRPCPPWPTPRWGPVKSFITKFRAEFEDYIRNQRERKKNPYPVKWR